MQVIVKRTILLAMLKKPITQALICSERMTVLISKNCSKKFYKSFTFFYRNILQKIKKYNCVPKIIYIDFKNLIISISYKQIEKSNSRQIGKTN